MKNSCTAAIILFLLVTSAACKSKQVAVTGTKQETATASTVSVSGNVKEINQGKDGYTAKIISPAGLVYFATISIPNLKDPGQYRKVAIGETITVRGETWKMENENHITVRELKQ